MATEPPAALLANLDDLEEALREALSDGPKELIEISRYVMGWQGEAGQPLRTRGKRIRPALCLFAATLFGQPVSVAMPGAVAIELIHNFSLVHDEVQDHDAERHHRPTVWALMGEGQAINAGDFLITRAIAALTRTTAPAERRLAALDALNTAMARMIAGQWADISFETRDNVAVDEYLAMVAGKTGALLGAPLTIGALLAGADPVQAHKLGVWGETVGLAFQIQDDYLGIWGDPNLTGKSNVNDIVRKKRTLPIIHGANHSPLGVIQRVYASESVSESEIAAVVAELEATKSDEFTRAEAARLVGEADALLASFELSEGARRQLAEIGTYLVERDR